MSAADKEILKIAGLTYTDAALALGVTRQSLSAGVAQSDKVYLDKRRIREIHKWLLDARRKNDAKEIKLYYFKTFGEEDAPSFEDEEIKMQEVFELDRKYKELWVFTRRPLELIEDSFAETMAKTHWLLDDTNRNQTTVYFVGREDAANAMALLCDLKLKGIPKESRAGLHVLFLPAVSLSPHYVIFEPRTRNPGGAVLAGNNGSQVVYLPPDVTKGIVEELTNNGVGLDIDRLISPATNKNFNIKIKYPPQQE